MRGVPVVDAMGIQALQQIVEEHHRRGGKVYFSGLQPAVRAMFDRTGLTKMVGEKHILWDAAQAIIASHQSHELDGCAKCDSRNEVCDVLRAARRRSVELNEVATLTVADNGAPSNSVASAPSVQGRGAQQMDGCETTGNAPSA